ncbi:DUF4357 domain-containing protein [Cryobacterium sp. M91]|uniref:DUF4357 domain-containing protein n=1 Tax=Cryobacterium sp. M91 TaxID=2048294 RepID=UPI000CE5067B
MLRGPTVRDIRSRSVCKRHGYGALHGKLIADASILVESSGRAVFARDVAFASPSAAGAVVTGRTCNGRTAWLSIETGETFGHWQSRGLGDSGVLLDID